MSYILERFGAIELPAYNRIENIDPVAPRTAVVATAAGSYDVWGSDRAAQKFPHRLQITCVAAETSIAALRTVLDALRAAQGTREYLYRRADDDGAVHRCTARLVDVAYSRKPGHLVHMEVKLTWDQLDQWEGRRYEGPWQLDDGHELDAGLFLDAVDLTAAPSVSIVNQGNLPARNVVLTITVSGAGLNYIGFTLPSSGVAWSISDTPADGTIYVMDSSARSLTKNGAAAYSLLTLNEFLSGDVHTAREWIVIEPGVTDDATLVLAGTGGATATAILTFAEAWA
jgi:hypothetical protein